MPTKPVISIDVDASKFDAFYALFSEYQGKLAEQPAAWDALNESMAGAGETLKTGAHAGEDALEKASGAAERITVHLRQAGTQQQFFSRATKEHARGFADLSRAGKGAWQAIGGAADASLAKVGSGLSGVLSALGPIGIAAGTVLAGALAAGAAAKTLADAAVTRQRSAFGLGTTTGRQASFSVYGQQFFGDGQQALQSAANVQSNFGNAGALGALGIDFNKARGMSKSDLAFEMLKSGVRIANESPDLPLGNNPLLAQYAALTGDKDFDQLRNAQEMLKTDPRALEKAQADTNRNTGRMELNRGAVANSALLKKAVEGAGIAGQSWAVNNLSGADPAIAKGLDAISGDKGAQASISSAVTRVADTIDKKAVPALENFNHALNTASGGVLHNAKSALNDANAWFNEKTGGALTTGGMMMGPGGKLIPVPKGGAGKGDPKDPTNAILSVANKLGVDPLLALAGAGHESGLNPKSRVRDFYSDGSFAGYSTGLYQLNDNGMGHGMSIADMMDPTKNAMKELPEYARVAKAHPHWSPGEIAFSAEGAAAGPNGTWKKSYIDDVNARYAPLANQQRNSRPPTILVEVSNPTQSRVSVSVKAGHS
jgi:hypothetical protein